MITNLQKQRAKDNDLIEIVIGLEIPYVKGSDHIKIRCINHDERSPSLAIYSDHAFCFGCNYRTDAIGFVQKFLNVTFKDAVEVLNKYHEETRR
jgi:DNA primase